MKSLAALYRALDASTSTSRKVQAMVDHFRAASAEDAAWAAYVLAGGKPRQAVGTAVLREAARAAAGIDEWLFEECYAVVGDLAETIAYLTPEPDRAHSLTLAQWMDERILPLRGLAPAEQLARVREDWRCLDEAERFLYVKLIGGGLRVGVSRLLVQRALAEAHGLAPALVAHRMMGYTDARQAPDAARFRALVAPDTGGPRQGVHPYPFFLAQALPDESPTLGATDDWLVEWKYDGIRAQVMRRGDEVAVWSRGEELVSERFPEVVALARRLPPGTVLDGEILAWLPGDDHPAPFALLQTRIGRLKPGARALQTAPVRFLAYDLLEADGRDCRGDPLHARRAALEALGERLAIAVSPRLRPADWTQARSWRAESRARGVEGLMLKQLASGYGVGRTRSEGLWWKWKIDPMSVDAVLIYAQAGHGRRANVYTDYTFAVWNRAPRDAAEAAAVVEAIRARRPPEPGGLQLVSFAKAYSGLSDEAFQQVDRVIRQTTVERFGPVRSVAPSLVFELGFEGISRSPRHKSGVATRFPRMLRLREDKPLHEADTLASLMALLGDAR